MNLETEFLNDWEILAVTKAFETFSPMFEPRSAAALLEKLRRASHVRLSYVPRVPQHPGYNARGDIRTA